MNTDRKFLQTPCALFATIAMFLALLIPPNSLKAEGSVDFINNDGYRLFYFAERPQQLKVYANAGEFINFGASHVGVSGGFISVYRPDGTLHSTYNNTGSSIGEAIINNNIEELNGPTGGGSLQGLGYDPGIVEVDPGEEGIWTIMLEYGFYQFAGFDNLLNNEAWTRTEDQPTNRRVVLSWDITISQNAAANEGGNMLTGRVFTNEYQSILNENGVTTSPTYFLLTNEGFQFQIDYSDVDPWGFQINSNNKGITTGDLNPTYSSFELNEVLRSADVNTFTNDQFYLYEPQARDINGISNNKVFFNIPDPNMPATALVTDIARNDTHTTWLYSEAPDYEIEIIDIELIANDPVTGAGLSDVLDRNNGALITYNTNLGGNAQLVIDIDNDGIFGNNNDRIINQTAINGENQILWDGLDQNGTTLPQQFNRALAYRLVVNAGELHLTLSDIENDNGGVRLTRLNGNAPSDEFLYDHSRLGEAISGDGPLPELTSEPFTFSNNFGDLKMLDYWTYVASVSTVSSLLLDIVDDVAIIPADSDGDGIRDDNDIDNDNDGILDQLEICAGLEGGQCFPNGLDPDFDEDFDGVPNYLDADDPAFDLGCDDANNDGICDQILFAFDVDQDGVPNHLDLDADNDGIVDILEADHDFQDTDGNGTIDGTEMEFGQNGLFNPLGSDDDDLAAVVTYLINDADGDTHPDAYDLDSDNDGIYDVAEANFGAFDTDENGMLASGEAGISVNANGLISLIDLDENGNQILFPLDNDSDQIFNFRDRDSDNDGLTDAIEGRNPDSDGDGVVGSGSITVNELGVAVFVAGEAFTTRSNIADHDGDAIEDYRDLDSDNDGIFDVAEALLADADNDGFLFTGTSSIDQFGMQIAPGATQANYIGLAPDKDGDTVANYLDRDSDNDGIHDVTEAGNEDPEGDGVIGLVSSTDVNSLGVVISVQNAVVRSTTANNDSDNLPDFLDLDADNDGINDVIEGGNVDPENDGQIGVLVNAFGQVVESGQIITTSFPKDNDGDGVPNYHDLDSDNDGLNDVVEGGNLDPDNDGVVGEGNPATDIDGQVIGQNGTNDSTSFPLDTDGDGIFDYEDLDSDNDGIFDVHEGQLSDEDNDGVLGVGEVEVDENGQVILPSGSGNTSNPVDTDGDGIPDFRDIDSDNDQINDMTECPNGAPCPDVDQSGIPDFLESNSINCPIPLVTPTVDHDDDVCSTDMLSLTVNESSTYETSYPNADIMYVWTNANGQEIMSTTDPNYNIAGDDPLLVLPLTVVVMVDEECQSSASAPVEVNVITTPSAIASASFDNVCVGGMVQLFAEDVDGATYQWFFNTFPFSTTQNPTINALNQSTNFGLRVTLDGCVSELGGVFIIADEPAIIEAQLGTGEYCAGEDVIFTAINNNTDLQGTLTYTLTGPDGLMVEVDAPANGTFEYTLSNVDFVNGGDYSLVVDNGNNCVSNVENFDVSISEGIEQPAVIVSDENVCSGDDFMLTTQTYTGPNVEYSWILNGTLITTTSSPEFMVNNATAANVGNYQVQVSTGICGTSTSPSVFVSLTDTSILPEIESNLTSENACEGQVVNLRITDITPETIYTWFDPSGNTIATNVTEIDIVNIQASDAGIYTVEANINGCAIRTDQEEIEVSEGLETPDFDSNSISTCAGEDVSIVINNFTSSTSTTYSWFTSNDVLFTQTTTPVLVFTDVDASINDGYYVVAEEGECVSSASTTFNVTVIAPPNEMADAGQDMALCQTTVVNLSASAPSQGTGSWTGANGTIVDANNPTTQINNLAIGDNMFIWSLSANGCMNYSTDTVIVSVSDIPNETATIFNTESSICSSEANNIILSADEPNQSTGQWILISGPSNATFTDETLSFTSVDGLVPGTYEVAWQLNSAACGVFSTDSYTFTIDALPTDNADAGPDQSFCQGAMVTTLANAPSAGMGTWSSNTGAIFSDINDPNASVSGLAIGVNVLTWTLSNESCQAYDVDETVVEISTSPNEEATVLANTIRICEGADLNLEAVAPSNSNGAWTQVSGAQASIATPNSNNTSINYSTTGSYTFVWELSTDDCGAFSTANVEVVIDELPTQVADAGVDQTICGSQINLNAEGISVGEGFWTSTSGNIIDPSSNNTTVTDIPAGTHTFTWTLSNGACEDYSSDQVTIVTSESPNETAQVVNDVVDICADANTIVSLNAIAPTMSAGVWTQIDGPNTTTILNASNETATATGLMVGQYTYAWTLSAVGCVDFSTATFIVNVIEVPTNQVADAGSDIEICGTEVNLSANTVTVGQGVWTSTAGDIIDANDPNTTVNNLPPGVHTFTWSLSIGQCENYSTDQVTVITSDEPNEMAEVVNDLVQICADFSTNNVSLVAVTPNTSTGFWTQVSGPIAGSIDDPTSENTIVSDLVAGEYTFTWTLSNGACEDFSTALVTVQVDEIPMNEVANAGLDRNVCSVSSMNLNATMPSVGTGAWTIFNTVGASVIDVNDPNTEVILVEGQNTFVWSLSNGGCQNYQTDTVFVFVNTPVDEAVVLTNDVNICESDVNGVTLNAGQVNTAMGVWTQVTGPNNATIDNPNNNEVNVTDLMPGTYSFQWTLSDGICTDYDSDFVSVVISALPDEVANVAQDEIVVCSSSETILTAGTPTESMGVWSTDGSSTIVTANSESTAVNSLQPGANEFTWTLSSGNCIDFSTASITVFVEDGIAAVNDTYSIEGGTILTDENVLDNESFNGNTDWTVALAGNFPEVIFNNDGVFTFTPAAGFSGAYTFEYEVCDISCDVCERATVSIDVAPEPTLDCVVPNVLTPNNDDKNDALIIDCANQFQNNIIQIFNRWGDKVHEQVTYQNDWRGTYNGDDLPAGTYFYIFKKDQNDSEAITGYITIIR